MAICPWPQILRIAFLSVSAWSLVATSSAQMMVSSYAQPSPVWVGWTPVSTLAAAPAAPGAELTQQQVEQIRQVVVREAQKLQGLEPATQRTILQAYVLNLFAQVAQVPGANIDRLTPAERSQAEQMVDQIFPTPSPTPTPAPAPPSPTPRPAPAPSPKPKRAPSHSPCRISVHITVSAARPEPAPSVIVRIRVP